MRSVIWGLNELKSNVWSVLLIGAAVLLIMRGHEKEGEMLLVGAFGVFKSGGKDADQS